MNNKDEILKLATEVANQGVRIEYLRQKKRALEQEITNLNNEIRKADQKHLEQAKRLYELAIDNPKDQSIVFNFGDKVLAITEATHQTRYAEYFNTIPAVEETNGN